MQEVELYPHQKDAVRKLHNGCILCGGVGTGKSRVAMQYYVEKESPKDVYVITTAKKRDSFDWESEAILHGVGSHPGAVHRGVLKVDSWNNLWRYVDVEGAFFVFDEQRLVGSGAWVKVFQKIAKKNNWIMLSATPGDTWMDYIPVFVANGFYKNKTEFLREHVIFSRYSKFPKVDRYIAVGRLVKHRNNLLVDMPYERHTVRHIQEVNVDYDEPKFKEAVKTRWDPFLNEPMKDVAALFRVMRRIVNSDPSRVETVKNLMSVHPRLIVFYNFDYELELLRRLGGIPSPSAPSPAGYESSERSDSNDSTTSSALPTSQAHATSPDATGSSLSVATNFRKDDEPCPNQWCSESKTSKSSLHCTCSHHGSNKSSKTSSNCLMELSSESIPPTTTCSISQTSSESSRPQCPATPTRYGLTGAKGKIESSTAALSSRTAPCATCLGQERVSPNSSTDPVKETKEDSTATSLSMGRTTSSKGRHSQIGSGVSTETEGGESWETTSSTHSRPKPIGKSKKSSGESSKLLSLTDGGTISAEAQESPQHSPSTPVPIAEWNGHRHDPIPETDRWLYLVQYTAGAEGWNCVSTDAMVFYSLTYSYRNFHQSQGRIDRLNTLYTDLYYYVLKSNSLIDKAIWKALNIKQKFNEPRNEADFQKGKWS